MFISTVIPTIGRPTLERAVNSVLEQVCTAEFEVIVVNDSGKLLTQAAWQDSPRVRVMHTRQRERSVARNSGAAVATGRYLHFLDDDDWLLPGAFQALKDLADTSQGLWLYGASQLVDRRGNKLIELHHEMSGNIALPVIAGEWIPLQSSIFEASLFFANGGFDPLIPGAEDIAFTRQVALDTNIAGTNKLVACIGMGTEDSSTNYVLSRKLISILREKLLDRQGTFRQLRSGATSAYWSGRLTRIYLTSVILNMKQGRITTAISRLVHGLRSLFLPGYKTVSPAFWQALTKPYKNETFQRGFNEAGLSNDARANKMIV